MPRRKQNIFGKLCITVKETTSKELTWKPKKVNPALTKVSFRFTVRQLGHINGIGSVGQREFDSSIMELLNMWATALIVGDFLNTDDLSELKG